MKLTTQIQFRVTTRLCHFARSMLQIATGKCSHYHTKANACKYRIFRLLRIHIGETCSYSSDPRNQVTTWLSATCIRNHMRLCYSDRVLLEDISGTTSALGLTMLTLGKSSIHEEEGKTVTGKSAVWREFCVLTNRFQASSLTQSLWGQYSATRGSSS